MKVLKKNHLVILVIALMLITAGYLNYNTNNNNDNSVFTSKEIDETTMGAIGDATLVSSNAIVENNESTEQISNTSESETNSVSNEIVANTNVNNEDDNYFTSSKLERDKMYSQMLETYEKILENPDISNEQKSIAQKEINKINNTKNAIMISENLLGTKGFEKNVIFINGDSINVVIKKESITQEEIAQVQNVVQRELNAEIENIHIVTR